MLPIKMDHPTYSIKLPSNDQEIKFRPFLEGERKVLLMALEGNDPNEIMTAIIEILKNCCKSKIDIDKLTTIDVEYFFLNLRAKSVGETVKLNFRCDNTVDNKPCGNIMVVDIDITTVDVTKPTIKPLVKLTPKLAIEMKYPNFKAMIDFANDPNRNRIYDLVALSVDRIFDGETILYSKDYPMEDIVEFVLSLTIEQFGKLEEYVNDLPVISKSVKCMCKKCNYNHDIKLEGYQSFFL